MNNPIPIFLLHGLGAHAVTLYPLSLYLQWQGYTNVHTINYPVDNHGTIDESVNFVSDYIDNVTTKTTPIILVGQSMGGVIANNLHKKGWTIKHAIYIGSPLHGAQLLTQLEDILPTKIRDALHKKPYDILKNKERESPPPHTYNTISMGWFNTEFDGCVYKDETVIEPTNHTHLPWADHRTIFANPRLWTLVHKLIRETSSSDTHSHF